MSKRLLEQTCRPYAKGAPCLSAEQAAGLFAQVPDWRSEEDGKAIYRIYEFRNYWETIAFVNALAWVVHREDHHPDLQVSYKRCRARFTTHSVGGLSPNDFICAAKIDALYAPPG